MKRRQRLTQYALAAFIGWHTATLTFGTPTPWTWPLLVTSVAVLTMAEVVFP